MTSPRLRRITQPDHAAVLALNERHVDLLAPMDRTRLVELEAAADTAAVIEVDGGFAGFVLTFTSGAHYDGENFAWFGEHYDDFCYLDRVVVHESFRRRGLGSLVYDALETGCDQRWFTLEINLDPPNEPSLAFHRTRGFTEVGQRTSHGLLVSLMAKDLARG